MRKSVLGWMFSSIVCLVFLPMGQATAETSTATPGSPITLTLNHPSRTSEEKARDTSRKPAETLAFFGFQKNMQVIELFPGRGWYTKILAPSLEDEGQLYLAIATDGIKPKLEEFGFGAVKIIGEVKNFHKTDLPGYIFAVDSIDLQQRNVDMVITFRNTHNFTSESRMILNRAVFDALKPGGIYGIIDHTARHMAKNNAENWRRVDPVQIIKETLDSGFELVAFSDVHARSDDDLTGDTDQETFANESDRFTLKFRKPLK